MSYAFGAELLTKHQRQYSTFKTDTKDWRHSKSYTESKSNMASNSPMPALILHNDVEGQTWNKRKRQIFLGSQTGIFLDSQTGKQATNLMCSHQQKCNGASQWFMNRMLLFNETKLFEHKRDSTNQRAYAWNSTKAEASTMQ